MGARRTLVERFWEKVRKDGPVPGHRPDLGPCWVWTATKSGGYGAIRLGPPDQKSTGAHVVSFFLEHGRWPHPFACHHCDNKSCVRPSHLYEGTPADNSRDARERGLTPTGDRSAMRKHPEAIRRGDAHWSRQKPHLIPRGARNGKAKLTEEQLQAVMQLLADGVQGRKIAKQFGVHESTISNIKRGWNRRPFARRREPIGQDARYRRV